MVQNYSFHIPWYIHGGNVYLNNIMLKYHESHLNMDVINTIVL